MIWRDFTADGTGRQGATPPEVFSQKVAPVIHSTCCTLAKNAGQDMFFRKSLTVNREPKVQMQIPALTPP